MDGGGVAGACLTMVTSTPRSRTSRRNPRRAHGERRGPPADQDGDITAAIVPDQLMVDVEGTLLSPAAYDLAGLARGQAVAVTLAAPPGRPLRPRSPTSVPVLGASPSRASRPVGPAPTTAPPAAPSGSIALTVLPLQWSTPATPPHIPRWGFDEAAAAWNGFSDGRLTVTPDVRGWATASGGRNVRTLRCSTTVRSPRTTKPRRRTRPGASPSTRTRPRARRASTPSSAGRCCG